MMVWIEDAFWDLATIVSVQGVIIAIFVADQSCTLAPQHGSYPLKWIQITLESRM